MGRALLFLLFLPLASSAQACILSQRLDNPDPTMDCPEDVRDLAERVVMCIHWGGEDGYDEERRKDISDGWEKSRCDTVACDMENLLAIYAKESETREVVTRVRKQWIDAYGEEMKCQK